MLFLFHPVMALISFLGGTFVGAGVSYALLSRLRNQPNGQPNYQKRSNLEPYIVLAAVGGLVAVPVYTGLYYLADRGTIWDGLFHGLGWFVGAFLVGRVVSRKQRQL